MMLVMMMMMMMVLAADDDNHDDDGHHEEYGHGNDAASSPRSSQPSCLWPLVASRYGVPGSQAVPASVKARPMGLPRPARVVPGSTVSMATGSVAALSRKRSSETAETAVSIERSRTSETLRSRVTAHISEKIAAKNFIVE